MNTRPGYAETVTASDQRLVSRFAGTAKRYIFAHMIDDDDDVTRAEIQLIFHLAPARWPTDRLFLPVDPAAAGRACPASPT